MTKNKDIPNSKDKYDKLNESKKVYVKSLDMEMGFMDFLNLLCYPKEYEKIRNERRNKKK